MATQVEISNLALSMLGADTVVVSLSPPDGSVEAGLCARFYPFARRVLLTHFEWAFATSRKSLAPTAQLPGYFAHEFLLPSDYLKVVRVLQNGKHLQEGADYVVEGNKLLTHLDTATITYIRDETNTSMFTPAFESALIALLGSYLAGPIIRGGEGARAGQSLRERAMDEVLRASVVDANMMGHKNVLNEQYVPEGIKARQ